MRVGTEHTAHALGNTGMHVLATAFVVYQAEAAAASLLRPLLDEGEGIAGFHIDLYHRAPAAVGAESVARSRLVAREGRRCHFRFTVHVGDTLTAEGDYTCVIVDLPRLFARAQGARGDARSGQPAGREE